MGWAETWVAAPRRSRPVAHDIRPRSSTAVADLTPAAVGARPMTLTVDNLEQTGAQGRPRRRSLTADFLHRALEDYVAAVGGDGKVTSQVLYQLS